MEKKKISRLQIVTHIGSLTPLGLLVLNFFLDNLTADPIQAATQRTGNTAIALLALSLACTPINTLTGFSAILKLRRPLGLYAFLYAAIHLLIYVGWDYGFAWGLIFDTLTEKRFILAGSAAFVILLALALTSFKWSMRQMGKNWKRLHRLVYAAGGLVVLHYAWALKGDLLRLQGDVFMPLFYIAVLAILLVLRIPAVRMYVTKNRPQFIRDFTTRFQPSRTTIQIESKR